MERNWSKGSNFFPFLVIDCNTACNTFGGDNEWLPLAVVISLAPKVLLAVLQSLTIKEWKEIGPKDPISFHSLL